MAELRRKDVIHFLADVLPDLWEGKETNCHGLRKNTGNGKDVVSEDTAKTGERE